MKLVVDVCADPVYVNSFLWEHVCRRGGRMLFRGGFSTFQGTACGLETAYRSKSGPRKCIERGHFKAIHYGSVT